MFSNTLSNRKRSLARYATLVCLSIINIILVIVVFISVNDVGEDRKIENKVEQLSYSYQSMLYPMVEYEGQQIYDELFLKFIVEEGLYGHPVLVIRYSAYDCTSCVDYLARILKASFPDIEQCDNIIFIACNYPSGTQPQYGRTLFMPMGEMLGLDIEEMYQPFMFVYDNGIHNLFLPDVALSEATATYIDAVKRKYKF